MVINTSKSIAPWIPYIGLTLAGITIGRYAYTRYLRHRKETEHAQSTQKYGEEMTNKSEENGTDETERGVKPEK